MTFVRSIGRWTMTALVINSMIGTGIFALPGELNRLLGRASLFAVIFAAIAVAIIMACVAEVASQFSEPGGAYLYTRTAFGSFVGMQTGWFFLLAVLGGVAVCANLFVDYLAPFLPWTLHAWDRGLVMAGLILIPTAANYRGVRIAANLSTVMTVAKLLPLVLIILCGIAHFVQQPQIIRVSEFASPGWSKWVRAIALLIFPFAGWEESLIPTGEIRQPRRTIPLALATGLATCATVYALLQFITVSTVGLNVVARPLARTASVLLGAGGATLVSIAIMLAAYGYISANLLNDSRLVYSLAAEGDFPRVLARIHPRFNTPSIAIIVYAFTGWVLAVSSTFQFVLALSAGSAMVYYVGICTSLIRLRRLRPGADAFRIPFGPVLSIIAVVIPLGLMTGLRRHELLFMCITAAMAAANSVGKVTHRPIAIKNDNSSRLSGELIMASLSDPLIQELLSGRYIAPLATLNRDLSIHVVAVWYWSDGAKVYVATAADSHKAHSLQSNSTVSLMIDARDPLASRGATIMGIGRLLNGESAREWNTKVHRKYLTESALMDTRVGPIFAAWDDIAIEVTPREVIAWDMRQVDQQVFSGVFQQNPGYLLATER